MNVVRCENGDYFDGDKYDRCPHCGASVENKKNNAVEGNNSKKDGGILGGIFSRRDKVQEEEKPVVVDKDDLPTMPLEEVLDANVMHSQDSLETESYYDDVGPEMIPQDDIKTKSAYDKKENDEVTEDKTPLKSIIQNASANSEGKTMGIFQMMTSNVSNENVGTRNTSIATKKIDPVVGWLVCVKGAHFGEAFNVAAGINSIGRYDTNKIVIADDNGVSREKHAYITYEPKKRDFYIKPGDSSGLTYVNDDFITETRKLSPRDIVELGNSKFVFVPLCDESFSWEDYLTKE